MTVSLQYKSSLESAIYESLSECKTDGNYKCDKCHRESKAMISHDFVKLPHYLVFHVKRFDSIFNKIKSNMSYPAKLNLN